MHVSDFPLDLNWFLQFVVAAFVIALGTLFLVKKTASKYLMVDANFDSSDPVSPSLHGGSGMPVGDSCVVCGNLTTKQCSKCKLVRYCSEACQSSHWKSGHKAKCKDLQLSGKVNLMQHGRRDSNAVTIVPADGTTNSIKQSKEILFPYEDFVELFNWDKPGFPPCGLLNCGNSCFANVVLQCLAHTRPLVAYLLEKGHKRECRRNDWCFLCEFQTHVERASGSRLPFSPISILSRLPNIGGNLGYGKQEDAHEFMRFAIDTMQSVCLDEFGGEKNLHPSTQETTLIQHIFGGQLQSQVVCSKCNNISNQFENMMDLTVEIHGGAESLEECLDQFTVSERLHGDNMYKCDGCNNYVMAWKRLTVRRAPNILTIAFKRFQSGRFGKLNKRVTFPETLDLSPYMSEAGDGNNVYKLYAVVVHIDMLNASFFGHYICYAKDFSGNWYRIDDCKVTRVDLEEVLSQGAYMLLYSRVCPRPSCLKPIKSSGKEQQSEQSVECFGVAGSINNSCSGSLSSGGNSQVKVSTCEEELSPITNFGVLGEDLKRVDSGSSSSVPQDIEVHVNGYSNSNDTEETASVVPANKLVSGGVSSQPGTQSASSNSAVAEDRNKTESNAKKLTDPSASSLLAFGTNKSTDSSIESSLPMLNGACEGGGMSHDASVAVLTPDEPVDEIDSKGERKRMVTGKDLPTSSSIKDAAGRLVGRNSSGGAKLKPLFPSGFLGKRPGNKSMKRDAGFLDQNGARKKEVGKPRSECPSTLPHFEEQVGNSLDKDTMLPGESVEFTNLCNGDSGAFIASDKDVSVINRDDQQVVEKTLSCHEELHGPCESTP